MGTEVGVKLDSGKLKYHLVQPEWIEELCKVLTFGANKYTEDGWKHVESGEKRYYSALMRHLQAYRLGEKCDPESGISHLAHAMTNICMLMEFENNKK